MEKKKKELYDAIMETLVGYSVKEAQAGMKRLRAAASAYFSDYEAERMRKIEADRRYEAMRITDMET